MTRGLIVPLPVHIKFTYLGAGCHWMTWGLLHKRFPFILNVIKFSFCCNSFPGHQITTSFAHVWTARLPCHVQQFVAIDRLIRMWKRNFQQKLHSDGKKSFVTHVLAWIYFCGWLQFLVISCGSRTYQYCFLTTELYLAYQNFEKIAPKCYLGYSAYGWLHDCCR